MNEKPKVEGWRKLGIGATAIVFLATAAIEFKIALIIGTVAIVGIICQSVLDYGKEKPNVEENTNTVNPLD